MIRWVLVAALGALSSTVAIAAVTNPAEYTISLTNWDANQNFDFTPNVPIPTDLTDNPCYPVGDICGDPSVGLEKGGDATNENGEFSFSSGPTGTVSYSYINTGTPITTVEISTTLNTDELGSSTLFNCYSNIYQDCTFVVTDPPSGYTMDIYFWDPYVAGGIPTTVPEPSPGIFVLLGFAGVVVARARKRSANSFLAQRLR